MRAGGRAWVVGVLGPWDVAEVRALAFDVLGTPTPQGSKTAYVRGGRAMLVESAGEKLRTWREDVKHAALDALAGSEPMRGPIGLHVHFWLPRPRSHYRTGRNAHLLRDGAPTFPAGRPDIDKLLRGTLDALGTAGVWSDDAQVVTVRTRKRYAVDRPPGAGIEVWEET